jgi:hypothetical protein
MMHHAYLTITLAGLLTLVTTLAFALGRFLSWRRPRYILDQGEALANQRTLDGIKHLIARMKARKAALHPERQE